MKQLGWANNWYTWGGKVLPEHTDKVALLEACKAAGHRPADIDKGPPNRGLDHVVTCDICEYTYHYDSSD
ncbi:MAG: hypothetical protein HGB05_16255 [Chloroflexi bacterium]|nr:hypothetical protein [Chloroflexota bacterium]